MRLITEHFKDSASNLYQKLRGTRNTSRRGVCKVTFLKDILGEGQTNSMI